MTGPQQKVGEFLTHWLEDTHKPTVRPRTYERYEAMIRLHLVILTHMPAKLNGKGGYVEAEPKTEKSRRSITIAPFALEKLKQHRVRQLEERLKAGEAWTDKDLVFCSTVGGHLHTSRILFAQFKALLKKAGLPNIRFHDLRHSSATMLLSIGVHPKVVQEILGHSQISMTMDIYSHVLPTMQQEAINKLNDVLWG